MGDASPASESLFGREGSILSESGSLRKQRQVRFNSSPGYAISPCLGRAAGLCPDLGFRLPQSAERVPYGLAIPRRGSAATPGS